MLFNSYVFILAFLPVTLGVFYLLGQWQQPRMAIAWLVGASLFFYGWWNPAYLGLIIASVLFNYAFGMALSKGRKRHDRIVLVIGIAGNLGLLGYFKYANFFLDNLNLLTGTHFNLGTIILPLGISFFTFQQITYLVDAYKKETQEYNFLHYCLFVTFFPQLIAGPIVHHREMLPQFGRHSIYRFNPSNAAVGITIFIMGLFKKVIIADGIAAAATPVFDAAFNGTILTFAEAWCGALAYTFQLYFDFSGYSDMAIGIGRMFGIRLPFNFHSPYKAGSIVDFWRRWHITLSRFLRDYLYIPFGGNRRGDGRRYINIMITMLLGGLWHGAGWTFVIWGGLHGVYLVINHVWYKAAKVIGLTFTGTVWWTKGPARLMTFLVVVVAWVIFRAADLDTALSMIQSMAGLNGFSLGDPFSNAILSSTTRILEQLVVLFVITWSLPNTQQILAAYRPGIEAVEQPAKRIQWRPNGVWAFFNMVLFFWAFSHMSRISEFLYFQF